MKRIILFDGECNFCDKSVQFILKRDPNEHFHFASLQSKFGKELLSQFNVPNNINSLVLIENNQCFFKSSAALRVCKKLKGAWKLLYVFVIVPKPLRDGIYHIIAKNRYKWFGKTKQCMLPSPQERKRFL